MDVTSQKISQALQAMNDYTARQRYAKEQADARRQTVEAEEKKIQKQIWQEEARRNATQAGQDAVEQTSAAAKAQMAEVARRAFEQGKKAGELQYATEDIQRSATEVATTVTLKELADAQAKIDRAASQTATAVASGTASAIASAARASSARDASAAAKEVARVAVQNLTNLTMSKDLADAAAAAAQLRFEQLMSQANKSAAAAQMAMQKLQADQELVDRSQAAVSNMLRQAVTSRRNVATATATAAANMTLVSVEALDVAANVSLAAGQVARDLSVKAAILAAFEDTKAPVSSAAIKEVVNDLVGELD